LLKSGKRMSPPVLYSLQNCPYAIRARMALLLAKQPVMLRPIDLKNKPKDMLTASPKGSVPVLVLDKNNVIDESLDIMIWALQKSDPHNLLLAHDHDMFTDMMSLINEHDNQFTPLLSQYKQAKRYHKASENNDRKLCEKFVSGIEQRLNKHPFILSNQPSLIDYVALPFLRQFAKVDRQWYLKAPYPKLQQWLTHHLQSRLYSKVMVKHPLWLETNEDILFV
jgi:glutathione S-transferase